MADSFGSFDWVASNSGSGSDDLIRSRALTLATEICDTFEWRTEGCKQLERRNPRLFQTDREFWAFGMLGDRVAVLCRYLRTKGCVPDADSIARQYLDVSPLYLQRLLDYASLVMTREEIAELCLSQCLSPPETENDCEAFETGGIMLAWKVNGLHDRVASIRQTLAEHSWPTPIFSATSALFCVSSSGPWEILDNNDNPVSEISAVRAHDAKLFPQGLPGGTAIPPEHRTRVMTKAEAAKLLNEGVKASNPSEFLKNLIEKKILTPPIGSGQKWQFDRREFPES